MESDIQFHKWQRLTCIFAKLCPRCSSGSRVSWAEYAKKKICVTDFPEHTRTRSFPITPSSPSSTIKICHQYPCDSRCHRLPFFSRVWHTARLYKLRDTQRSVTDRTKTYCALRRSSEEWATYWFHPPWFVHSRKCVISIQGQQSC